MEKIIADYQVWAVLLIFIVEYLIANTKVIKANSTVDMIINIIKFIFQIRDEEEK